MISRLTALAAVFSVLATATLTFASSAQHAAVAAPVATVKHVPIYQLERVVITAKRRSGSANTH